MTNQTLVVQTFQTTELFAGPTIAENEWNRQVLKFMLELQVMGRAKIFRNLNQVAEWYFS